MLLGDRYCFYTLDNRYRITFIPHKIDRRLSFPCVLLPFAFNMSFSEILLGNHDKAVNLQKVYTIRRFAKKL